MPNVYIRLQPIPERSEYDKLYPFGLLITVYGKPLRRTARELFDGFNLKDCEIIRQEPNVLYAKLSVNGAIQAKLKLYKSNGDYNVV